MISQSIINMLLYKTIILDWKPFNFIIIIFSNRFCLNKVKITYINYSNYRKSSDILFWLSLSHRSFRFLAEASLSLKVKFEWCQVWFESNDSNDSNLPIYFYSLNNSLDLINSNRATQDKDKKRIQQERTMYSCFYFL